jgi:excisionase family DNA binding protein
MAVDDRVRDSSVSGPIPLSCSPPGAVAVDLEQAGAMVGVSGKTIRREIERGNLRGLKIGRQWRVRMAELHAYVKRQECRS